MASICMQNKHFPCFNRTKRGALVGNSYKRLWLQGGREAVQCHHHHHHHQHQGGRESWWEDSLLTTSTRRWKLLLSRRSRGWGDKGNFCRSKTREGQQGGDIFAMPTPVLRCGDRHLEVKVEVSIRQGRFVGLIGHPHVFVPIMGLRAEGPAGRGAGQPGGPAVTLMRSVLNSAAPYLASTCATVWLCCCEPEWHWLSFLRKQFLTRRRYCWLTHFGFQSILREIQIM